MLTMLIRMCIRDSDNIASPAVRRAYGMLCSIVGIVLNILLFAGKYFVGIISSSIAITADAFNNLSDAGSAFISLMGFRLAGMKPDREHPFGHGRIEYMAGFIVSVLIILMGFELGKSSIDKILHPAKVDTGFFSIGVLIASICVKGYMAFYNTHIGKKIDSATMRATAIDSLSDSVATAVVLLSMLLLKYTGINIDGWCGICVAAFILYAGYSAAKETMSPLLGQAPSEEFVSKIEELVLSHTEIIGIHDLVVHDYGPGRVMISLHGEVDGSGNIFELHDAIDHIEKELYEKLSCEAVIHMDPVATDDVLREEWEAKLTRGLHNFHQKLSLHDFRVTELETGKKVVFDVVVPYDFPISDEEVKRHAMKLAGDLCENCHAEVMIDKADIK